VRLGNGGSLEYDALIVAIGARPYKWSAKGLTFGLERAGEGIHGLLADLELGYTKAVDFVVPPGTGWSLPVYELALMTAGDARAMGRDDIAVRVLTAEARPLAAFGEDASANVARVLSDGGVEVVCGVDVTAATDAPEHRVVTLPALHGPALEGLPHDADGFHPVDAFCEVLGLANVFVVGDAADHPVKQGGLAAQQADIAVRMIAARAGAHITPEPYKPVLRGMLLTDREPRFLRGGERAASSDQPLWWPTAKVAAPALARYLALKGLIAN
jgi:sulfide:quinone oxidoreductase